MTNRFTKTSPNVRGGIMRPPSDGGLKRDRRRSNCSKVHTIHIYQRSSNILGMYYIVFYSVVKRAPLLFYCSLFSYKRFGVASDVFSQLLVVAFKGHSIIQLPSLYQYPGQENLLYSRYLYFGHIPGQEVFVV